MTHYTNEITEEQQKQFWCNEILPGHQYEVYLLYDDAVPIGYGLLKREGDKKWMTAGLIAPYRGRGLSRMLIVLITEIAYADSGTEVWIDVEDTNLALIGDLKNGYRFISHHRDDQGRLIHVMKHQRDRYLGPVEQDRLDQYKIEASSARVEDVLVVDAISRKHLG